MVRLKLTPDQGIILSPFQWFAVLLWTQVWVEENEAVEKEVKCRSCHHNASLVLDNQSLRCTYWDCISLICDQALLETELVKQPCENNNFHWWETSCSWSVWGGLTASSTESVTNSAQFLLHTAQTHCGTWLKLSAREVPPHASQFHQMHICIFRHLNISNLAMLHALCSSVINRPSYPWPAEAKNVLKARRWPDALVSETTPSALGAEEVIKEGWVLYRSCEMGQIHSVTMEGGQGVQPAGRAQNWAQRDSSSTTISLKIQNQFLCPQCPPILHMQRVEAQGAEEGWQQVFFCTPVPWWNQIA